ncbi:MAG: aminotransferase class V-fold PLP-dependent enzyme [Betaproteobacteria bacterium]|nr:aminotransferase class V-fold PLP-dependent enzyme [Betaproteobacteria bacterium]
MNRPVEIDAVATARAHFPALERWTYLDVAGRGVLSREARAALDAHLDERMLDGGDKPKFFERVESARRHFAQLIHAAPEEIAFAKNISDGLNMVATAFNWKRGDNVILCPELEHPNNVYPWLNMQRYGLEARFVKPRDGHIPVDEIVSRIDGGTRVVTVSTVTFAPGFRTHVATLGRACRERGVLFLVDAAQSVGVIETDVRQSHIDALAVSTSKALLGLYGMGFLYCRREWAERMKPAYLARFGVDLGDAHEATLGDHSFQFAPAARRFDLGNYNFAACAAVDASLQQLLAWGTSNIERHVTGLAHALVQGFLDLGLPVSGGAPGPHLANIVTVGELSADHYGTGSERYNRLYEHLTANRVKLSIRRGTLRFSFHVYNNMDDVARVLELTRQFVSTDR